MRIGDHSADPDPQEAGRVGDGSLHPGNRHRSCRGGCFLLHSDQIHPVSDQRCRYRPNDNDNDHHRENHPDLTI